MPHACPSEVVEGGVMDIKSLSKKLRHAADVLDELLEVQGTPEIARRILSKGKRMYKKKHWTQRPENRARLKKILKHAAKVRHGQI